ncbi:LacI family transcriptional regulator [Prolixibacteraceae bacterium JC049]|nr:LacI family transcriptional regulator [Prolixibacteraceae bacterium JC049]
MRSSQVTIKDIAKHLGISASTVSRALKDHPDISEETKRMVKDLAAKLKYQPNALALSLKNSKSNTIGVIIPEVVHYFFSQVISGIEDVAYNAGYTVVICQSNERYVREVANTKALLAQRVDGVLVSISKETQDLEHLHNVEDHNIPMVFFDRRCSDIEADSVLIDDFNAAYQATKHLLKLGRKRIAHLGGPMHMDIGRLRKEGYMQALKDFDVEVDEALIFEANTFEDAPGCVQKMMQYKNPPDSLFAVNDLTAIGAIQAIQNMGLKIPEDISVVGFSDGRFSNIINPKLTSVDQHGYEMGRKATEILIKRIKEDQREYDPVTEIIPGTLIVRDSSVNR